MIRNNPDNAPHKQDEYLRLIEAMDDKTLFEETKNKIWLSAYASNNRHSCYHWQCDYTYSEWKRRDNVSEYSRAHREVSRG